MQPGDVVARLDRDLGGWGQDMGYRAYIVEAVSPSGSRVTLRDRRGGNPLYLTRKHEILALVPLTPEIEAEISRDTEWLKARRLAMDLHADLHTWAQKHPADHEKIRKFLEVAEPLRGFFAARAEGAPDSAVTLSAGT